jgi:predicted ATPase/DNA-binding winged helix-turn-helix (wHTH) protein
LIEVEVVDLAAAPGERAISFGPFRLLPAQRLLLEGDKPVRLGSRAFDILIALVERAGELVGKDELVARVWPNTFVEESNLKFQIGALRRALGDGNRYLVNVPGRGYSFTAPVTLSESPMPSALQAADVKRVHNLPAHLAGIIGRADTVGRLAARLPRQRLITIVGPGGIGKTTVAVAVAEALIPAYEHGVWLIDLAPLSDPRLVPSTLATALGLEIRSENPLPGLIAVLKDKRMLLVFDNCAHVIDAAADLAIAVLRSAPGVHLLATSREPPRIEGEHVHRLSPLASPPASARLTAAEALRFPAVQLFVERATESLGEFELSDADAPIVGEICNKLDGIALAIELAAARVDVFGVWGLAAHLDDRFRLLTKGRRTAVPRHRTLSATLDWSYPLLTEAEQRLLRRLSVFAGGFTLHAAGAVAADITHTESEIIDEVAELVTKSLVSTDVGDAEPRLLLLDTTRAYALNKLAESGEIDALGRRHATYFRDLLEAASNSSVGNDAASAYAPEIDNIRAALIWALAPEGDRSIAVSLAVASAPIWLEMSLLTECHSWMGKALDLLDDADRGTRREMVLQAELGLSLMHTGVMSSRARVALMRASELAESVQDVDYQLRALDGLTTFCHRLEESQGALVLARRSVAIAKSITDPVAHSTADCMLNISLFFLGDYAQALTYAQRANRRITLGIQRADIKPSGVDHSTWIRCIAAHILWLQGLLDQSAQTNRDLLADAEAADHIVSLCYALIWCGCPISLRLGDLETAGRSIDRLKSLAEEHALSSYYACGLGFEGQLSAKRGDLAAAERLLRASLGGLRQAQYEVLFTPFLSGLAEVLAAAGDLDDSLAVADEALQRTERNDAFWWMPEALRIKGDVMLLSHKADPTVAEDHFRRSLDMAHRQGALSWELRTAMSFARLQHDQGRIGEARDLLASVYGRFTESFGTADLKAARLLLDELTDVVRP